MFEARIKMIYNNYIFELGMNEGSLTQLEQQTRSIAPIILCIY